jgi:leader peptidase (prepilin peptidase)/N-methyltransferase
VAESAIGALVPSLILWGFGALYQRLRHREGLGFGDVKMVAMIGAFFGLPGALFTLMLGSILGSVVGLGFILIARKQASTYELPFGSFLGVAALALACYLGPIAAWKTS